MLKRILGKFRLTPSVTLSLLALFVALGSTGWAANGGAFILGVLNSATVRTALVAHYNGTALQLSNASTGAAATALTLAVAAGHPPMKVNTANKVANLNADWLDGLDSTALTRVHNIPYNLPGGGVSASISFPANRPVQVVGVNLTTGDPGVGQASILQYSALHYIVWVGLHSWNAISSISQGASATPGSPIIYINSLHTVSVDVAGPNTIRVHNASGGPQFGNVSLMW